MDDMRSNVHDLRRGNRCCYGGSHYGMYGMETISIFLAIYLQVLNVSINRAVYKADIFSMEVDLSGVNAKVYALQNCKHTTRLRH